MFTRDQEIALYVAYECNGFWSSFDQGRWAGAKGLPRTINPHHNVPYHSTLWEQGYDEEAKAREERS
jgi:hypothetical protein